MVKWVQMFVMNSKLEQKQCTSSSQLRRLVSKLEFIYYCRCSFSILPKWHFLTNAWNLKFEIFWGQMTSFEVLLKCHSLTLSKKCLRLRPAPSKCLSERINWIIWRIPHRISKILFVYSSYEFLAMLEGKIRVNPFF